MLSFSTGGLFLSFFRKCEMKCYSYRFQIKNALLLRDASLYRVGNSLSLAAEHCLDLVWLGWLVAGPRWAGRARLSGGRFAPTVNTYVEKYIKP